MRDKEYYRKQMARIKLRRKEDPEFDKKWKASRVAHKRRSNARKTMDQKRERRLRQHYGLTLGKYHEMLSSQNGVCKICKGKCLIVKPNRLPLCVDHCHTTGVVRGLLCVKCNSGIGYLNHDLTRLRSAIEYLFPTQHQLPIP